MSSPSVERRFDKFNARVVVDPMVEYTIVGGRFSPVSGIDLARQSVRLSVAGATDYRLTLSAGSFHRTVLGGYVASDKRNSRRTDVLLQPFSTGDWSYSVGIESFTPGVMPVTVSLRIGGQSGSAKVKVYAVEPGLTDTNPSSDVDAITPKTTARGRGVKAPSRGN